MGLGFGGSFAQLIEIVDEDPNVVTKTKKKIWENEQWVDRLYIRIKSTPEMIDWLHQYYGQPSYPNGKWQQVVSGMVVMDDVVYTHWALCQ